MINPILGFTGASAEKRALKESHINPPRAYALPDGSLVGVGLTRMNYVDGIDRIDTALHGARYTSAKLSDFDSEQKKRFWLAMTGVERARVVARQKRAASK
jgi:hypothetical protein